MKTLSFALSLAASLLVASTAAAQDVQPFAHRSFVLPSGSLELTGTPARPAMVTFNLTKHAVFDPVAIHPHLYYGVTDKLTLGLTHQRGLCLGDSCGRAYNDAGLGLLYNLVGNGTENFELDLHLGVPVISSFDPFFMGVRAGVIGRVNFWIAGLVFDPSIYVGFTERTFNKEVLDLPVWVYFQVHERIAPYAGTGLRAPLDGFGDRFRIPFEAGSMFGITRNIDLGAGLAFDNALGKRGGLDARQLYMLGRFRFF